MASPLVGISAVNSLLFGAYATAKKIISPYPTLTLPQTALAGALAGAGNSLLASPVELFKIRMQGQYGGATDMKLGAIFREMYTKYGLRHGVMRGFWITVMREMPAYAGFYTTYEFSKRSLHKGLFGPHASSDVQLPVWATLLAGSTGGLAYWTACYPFGQSPGVQF
jgi:solute carrier family 25 carnitine/acylcarnitine transporter 20/29